MRLTKRAIMFGTQYGLEAEREEMMKHCYRKIYNVRKPRLHKYPKWLQYYRGFQDAIREAWIWDHVGSVDEWLVSEPYKSIGSDLQQRGQELADKYEMDFYYSSVSWWNPNLTVRLAWRPKRFPERWSEPFYLPLENWFE